MVAITELSHQLVLDHSAAGFARFAALTVPVYVAWQGYSSAMSAGARLLIERADDQHLGAEARVALLGGAVVLILSLVGTRVVAVTGSHRLGVTLKLAPVALIVG